MEIPVGQPGWLLRHWWHWSHLPDRPRRFTGMTGGSSYVVGVDGCRGGWVAVTLSGSTWNARIHPTFVDLVESYPDADRIAIDIPIGLATGVRRGADAGAKVMIRERRNSVFWSPDARILDYSDMAAANQFLLNVGLPRISIQTWCIVPKMREVNRAMTPELQDQVIEVHPEVSFAALAGRPMLHPKHRQPGYDERANLLREALGIAITERRLAFGIARPAKPDDLLDAVVAAWTARRAASCIAGRLPETPEVNDDGLRMEIVY